MSYIQFGSFAAVFIAVALSAPPIPAAMPHEKCEAKKLRLAGSTANCRLQADAKGRLKGEDPDHSKCDEKLATKFSKTEQRFGAGVCPTEGDQAAISAELGSTTQEIAEQLAPPDPLCAEGYRDRTTLDVINAYEAAFASEDWQALQCAYHPDAVVMDNQGVLLRHAEIISNAQSLAALYSHQRPTLNELAVFSDMARTRYSLDTGFIVIDDGTDTFIVKRGQIRRQTRHASFEFAAP